MRKAYHHNPDDLNCPWNDPETFANPATGGLPCTCPEPSPLDRARELSAHSPLLIVEQNSDGEIEAHRDGDTGMYIVGRGATVAEAVGMWAIYSGKLRVVCHPDPELLETRFRIHPENNKTKRCYKAADKRG